METKEYTINIYGVIYREGFSLMRICIAESRLGLLAALIAAARVKRSDCAGNENLSLRILVYDMLAARFFKIVA